MVESCFDEGFLTSWIRNPVSNSTNDLKERSENFMLFLIGEIERQERISLAVYGFGVKKGRDELPSKNKYIQEIQRRKLSTTFMLLASSEAHETKKPKCIFCSGKHGSPDSFNAQKLTLEEKQKILRDINYCFACLLPGNLVIKCQKILRRVGNLSPYIYWKC
ncbi:uncharacterized protein TNCV_1963261 [Trichonephila clavipes]|nr:uncharacterized protein TNCV_1963261 [Trichonephila clavipes]